MRKYRISVNGQAYDVMVEEVGAGASSPQPLAAAVPTAAAPAPSAPSAGPSVSGPVAGAVTVKAPMPGTVMSFKVIQGQAVKRGDVVLILEAMKMGNEIVAPSDGTIAAIPVPQGAAVNTGDPLVDLV
jgi:glutaconyl-CoA/methylmalonyl-CoA decarboxylase subunit gamma